MEKRINIAELLKDCSKGLELYSTIHGTVYFEGVRDTGKAVLIDVKTSCNTDVQFYSDGKFNTYYPDSEMTLFPSKDVRTWEGFVSPCKFKDGDILYARDEGKEFIFILKHIFEHGRVYCYLSLKGDDLRIQTVWLTNFNPTHRLATEEEKQKLFSVIQNNGYRWNAETKTLEKKPTFKDGDILYVDINDDDDGDDCFKYTFILKVMDGRKVIAHCYMTAEDYFKPREVYLVDDTYPIRFATEDEKQKLFQTIEENGYKWNAETKTLEKLIEPKFKVGDKIKYKGDDAIGRIEKIDDNVYHVDYSFDDGVIYVNLADQDKYELVPNKFDITALKPFESKVLVRDNITDEWRGHFFSHYDSNSDRPYVCIGVEGINEYKRCIPYKDNEHLLGKTDDCNEYYKNWQQLWHN